MSEEENKREYTVRDRPTETGLTINNILLAIVIVGGTMFGTVVIKSMDHITHSVISLEDAITVILVSDGVTVTELANIKTHMKICAEKHAKTDNRVLQIERTLGIGVQR